MEPAIAHLLNQIGGADLEPWLLVVGGLCVICGLASYLPKDFMMPPEDDED